MNEQERRRIEREVINQSIRHDQAAQEAWDEAMPGIKFDMTNESHQWTWAQVSDRIAIENWEDLLYLPLTDL